MRNEKNSHQDNEFNYHPDTNVPHVCVKGEWIDLRKTEFLDVSEDFQGFDLYSFSYMGNVFQSKVILKPAR
jgi:hypothetical protein